MSKIRSSKLAITKISIGVVVAVALVAVFACEQKESINSGLVEESVNSEQSAIRMTIEGDKIKIQGSDSDYKKIEDIRFKHMAIPKQEAEQILNKTEYLAKKITSEAATLMGDKILHEIIVL